MTKTKYPAPKHLRRSTKEWFASVVEQYELDEHHVKMLTRCAEAWDRGEEAREALAKHGLVFLDRFDSPRSRPEIAIERDARTGFFRGLRDLDLDCGTPSEPKRPPSLASNRR